MSPKRESTRIERERERTFRRSNWEGSGVERESWRIMKVSSEK